MYFCKISIIAPIFNMKNHIKRCLDSDIHQTYTNLEIILGNDGSTGSFSKIIDEMRMICKNTNKHEPSLRARRSQNNIMRIPSERKKQIIYG